MVVPRCIEIIGAKPGVAWSDEERTRMLEWWAERCQMKLVWHAAARYLGQGATAQDVEDAFSQFYLNFDQVRRSFRPNGISFQTYLVHVCFKNYCTTLGKRISEQQKKAISLDRSPGEENEYELQLEDNRPDGDPARQAKDRAFLEDLSGFLSSSCLNENQKQAFVLRYLKDLSYEEIAEKMQVPVGSVKGWLSRATHAARAYLKERGW